MSTIKTDTITAVNAGGDLSLDGLGTGGVSIASTLKMTKGGDIASASPLVIDTDGNYFDVTGTTSFAAMTVESGNFFMLQFDGALTITHGSGIELPGATNLTTAAGDRLICYATAANTVEVMSVETEAAAAAGGSLTFIGEAVASTSASLTVTGMTGYDSYLVNATNLVGGTDDSAVWIRFGDSSGVDSGSSDYEYQFIDHINGAKEGSTAAAQIATGRGLNGLSQLGTTANTAGSFSGQVYPGASYPSITLQMSGKDTLSQISYGACGGFRQAAITLDRIQILPSAGTFTTGKLQVWGFKNA